LNYTRRNFIRFAPLKIPFLQEKSSSFSFFFDIFSGGQIFRPKFSGPT